MKKLLLLALLAGASHVCTAQTTQTTHEISQDSLVRLYTYLDSLPVSELSKQREHYIYVCRTQPSEQHDRILAYIEEKLKTAKP